MEVVWERQPIAASDIAGALTASRAWHPQTVKTLLTRLVSKKALTYKAEGKRYLYRAKVSREAAVRAESRTFLSRLFGGEVTPAVVHLLSHAQLSDDEIAKLRSILNEETR
jgi:BlaI family penicillinase repressor